MLPWIIVVIVASAFGLMIGIELLMIRLGIRPADPDSRSKGIRDVAEKVHKWSAERRTDR